MPVVRCLSQTDGPGRSVMRRVFRVLGILALVLAGILTALTVAVWPPGGLMFALPYVFLLLAAPFALGGVILLILTRPLRESDSGR
jgi:hypothetical protein